jgi:hypothetical protein
MIIIASVFGLLTAAALSFQYLTYLQYINGISYPVQYQTGKEACAW